ncbi:MAG: hypothetical protein COT17_00725 [Elusimicrobia bacterium CG08_land_8_20_14_0_20_51_18]|nr:MAG: hypothetical protein COT17_00725 [Elusimicrobia bacterium CG08_land_8_20_14_0_20_51_18]
MLCQKCHKNKATVLLKAIVESRIKILNLCDACAAEKGFSYEETYSRATVIDYIENITEEFLPRHKKTLKCPVCGIKYSEFRQKGFLGCPDCYNYFGEEIISLLRTLSGGGTYCGRKYHLKLEKQNRKVVEKNIAELRRKIRICFDLEDRETALRLSKRLKELIALRAEGPE